eukprot:Gb_10763 [translate_table: standard]
MQPIKQILLLFYCISVHMVVESVSSRGCSLMGSPFTGAGMGSTLIFSSLSTNSHLKLFAMLCRNTSISIRANSFPGHILWPPPKGTNVYGAGPAPSNLDGSNFSGSSKNSAFL